MTPPRFPSRAYDPAIPEDQRPLSPKQKLFVEEYIVDMKAGAAAIRAGYSARTAYSHGPHMTKVPQIAAAIERALATRREGMQVTAERVIRELARIAFADIGRIIHWSDKGLTVKPTDQLSAEDRAAIAEVAVVKQGDRVAARVTLHDKERALVALCRHLGLFNSASRYGVGTAETPAAAAERIRALIRERFTKLIAQEAAEGENGDGDASALDARLT
jgi:phage terminase small subunit